jgi:hypothetical protein
LPETIPGVPEELRLRILNSAAEVARKEERDRRRRQTAGRVAIGFVLLAVGAAVGLSVAESCRRRADDNAAQLRRIEAESYDPLLDSMTRHGGWPYGAPPPSAPPRSGGACNDWSGVAANRSRLP